MIHMLSIFITSLSHFSGESCFSDTLVPRVDRFGISMKSPNYEPLIKEAIVLGSTHVVYINCFFLGLKLISLKIEYGLCSA